MKHPLEQIKIKGFKSIREADIELSNLNVLIGANGSGKSNFLSIFEMLNNIIQNNFQNFVGRAGGADALLYFGQKTTDELSLDFKFGSNGYEVTLAPAAGAGMIFSDEYCLFRGSKKDKEPYFMMSHQGHKETNLIAARKENPGGGAVHIIENLSDWILYHFHDTGFTSKMKQQCQIGDNAKLRNDASNLAAFLYMLNENEGHRLYYDRIVKTIRLAAPFFDDFLLRPHPVNNNTILLEWKEKNSDAYFNAHSLSDGTLRFICLATLLLQPELPALILIDEPELGLHPYALTLLASMLRSASTKTQVIVSTQSVTLVNQFSAENIIVVDRKDGQSTFRRYSNDEVKNWMDGYALGDLWEKNIIGGRP